MHDEIMKKPMLDDLCELERRFMEAIKTETAAGLYCESINIAQLGEVVDMLKDVIEAKKDCMKACYYAAVTKAMEEYEMDGPRYDYDEDGPMGYDNWRYPSSGRYAPKGHGRKTGFMPEHMLDMELFPPKYREMTDMMGYTDNRNSRIGDSTGGRNDSRFGRNVDSRMDNGRYGYSYNEYQHAKESGDKSTMDTKARTHVGDMISTTREIWKDADPALKKSLKEDLSAFVNKEMVM